MSELLDLYKKRYNKSADKIKKVFEKNQTQQTPFVISIRAYYSIGSSKGQMPEDYYDNPESMLRYQEEGIRIHLEKLEDDYIPYLVPYYGTGVLASAFGSEVIFPKDPPGTDPQVKGLCLNDIKDISRLKIPDPYKDGLMPKVLDTIDYMKENSDIPVSLTDIQGPLDTITLMCGHNNLFLWMVDDPGAIKHLFEIVTEGFIEWIKAQKRHTGEEISGIRGDQLVGLPDIPGIWFAEDDLVFVDPRSYEKFIKPAHQKILDAFDGGIIHFCGDASQHIAQFLELDKLSAINTWTLWNFEYLKKFQDKGIPLIVGDIAPIEIEAYVKELFQKIKLDNIILSMAVEENLAVEKGGYKPSDRRDIEAALIAYNTYRAELEKRDRL